MATLEGLIERCMEEARSERVAMFDDTHLATPDTSENFAMRVGKKVAAFIREEGCPWKEFAVSFLPKVPEGTTWELADGKPIGRIPYRALPGVVQAGVQITQFDMPEERVDELVSQRNGALAKLDKARGERDSYEHELLACESHLKATEKDRDTLKTVVNRLVAMFNPHRAFHSTTHLVGYLEGSVKLLMEKRDTAWQELKDIRKALDADPEESTLDEVNSRLAKLATAWKMGDAALINLGKMSSTSSVFNI